MEEALPPEVVEHHIDTESLNNLQQKVISDIDAGNLEKLDEVRHKEEALLQKLEDEMMQDQQRQQRGEDIKVDVQPEI